jgi:hypothetical protein
MADRIAQQESIVAALKACDGRPLAQAAQDLFAELGYASERRLPISTPQQFREQLDPHNTFTEKQAEQLETLDALHLLFQVTDTELTPQGELLDDPTKTDETRIKSYLFFAAELPAGPYTRTALSGLVRVINKPLPMPALVLFRHGESISIGIIHRRLHKRNPARDVLEKVTLIKDIACGDPIRAHIEILNDFVLANLAADYPFDKEQPFVSLHEAWQKRLGSYALSNDFYREIADWYFWAHHQVDDGAIRLPQHCDTPQEKSLFLIRLLTRVIFCWFLIEKRLIPTDLFRGHRLTSMIKDFVPSTDPKKPDTAPTYYRAVLQNLFFGTLNMPPEQRTFRKKKKKGERYDKNYGITNLWRYEATFQDRQAWEALAARIPFLNGGLFDCLDDKSGKKKDNFILDGFSDREDFGCHLPNDLFFGPERPVDLSKDYGEEKKKTARSKKAKVRGLVEILSRYKFTIEENTPLEEEIALDPELLGKVFENLLASYNEDTRTTARKALGAFYTPREIVNYMVDEALKSYLSGQVPRCKGVLDDLFSDKVALKEIKPAVRDALIAAIGRVKILDPACGSGAFPMGALHRLVDLLQKLDPNNESWKRDRLAEAQRYRDLLRESGAAKEEMDACDARIADIEKSFDTRFHALDFARKLYLVENCIYGVDIQPIATQIAKLRFFISLVVDQKVNPKSPNLGVRPLPNLETRLVAADTLIPLPKSKERQGMSGLDPEKTLIFRIVHVRNVLWILDHGLHCRNSDDLDPNYVTIGNPDLIDMRRHRNVPVAPGGSLAAYIPFYFTPYSIMLYNIKTGYGGIRRVPNRDIAILVSSLHKLAELDVPFVFTNAHAYPVTADYFNDLSHLDRIDWPVLQSRDFRHDPDDPGKKERYQAEALVYRHLPPSGLLGIGCCSTDVAADLKGEAESRNLEMKVLHATGMVFLR